MVDDHKDYLPGEAPAAHKVSHQDGGTDEISLYGLSGESVLLAAHKILPAIHHVRYSDAEAISALADLLSAKVSKTTAPWLKTIGSGGDYATWAAMLAAMPDLLSHNFKVTIKAGTTLTERCGLFSKRGLTSLGTISVRSEKYFPTTGLLPTADSATATTLRDAALSAAALGDDYFNGCWVFINHGTGTDNGFVKITDYIDTTGDVVVASWPGTQPDNTSRYLIVGALINATSVYSGFDIYYNAAYIKIIGIGIKDSDGYGMEVFSNLGYFLFKYCGIYNSNYSGIFVRNSQYSELYSDGFVLNNRRSAGIGAGLRIESDIKTFISYCGISDNDDQGIYCASGAYTLAVNNFGDNNGLWGIKAVDSARVNVDGSECSGSSGNHTNGVGDGSLVY